MLVLLKGYTLKLRESSKSFYYQASCRKALCGQVNNYGYGNNVKDVTMSYPQPIPYSLLGQVQRLDGCKFSCSSRTRLLI